MLGINIYTYFIVKIYECLNVLTSGVTKHRNVLPVANFSFQDATLILKVFLDTYQIECV